MRFFSIDIETTGLSDDAQILSIGACYADASSCGSDWQHEWPEFHAYIDHRTFDHFEIGAFGVNEINLRKLKDMQDRSDPGLYASEASAVEALMAWMRELRGGPGKVNVAGKNAAGFDLPFLFRAKHAFKSVVRARVLDPGMLYLRADDHAVPNLEECVRRAGLEDVYLAAQGPCHSYCRECGEACDEALGVVTHDALEDARMVAHLICHYYEFIAPKLASTQAEGDE